jgi:hypothetical protein
MTFINEDFELEGRRTLNGFYRPEDHLTEEELQEFYNIVDSKVEFVLRTIEDVEVENVEDLPF